MKCSKLIYTDVGVQGVINVTDQWKLLISEKRKYQHRT